MGQVEQILEVDPQFDQLPTEELMANLHSRAGIAVRARSLAALARRASVEKTLLGMVMEEIRDPRNMNARVFGSISVSHIGVAALIAHGGETIADDVRPAISGWPEPDRSDLLWFLRSRAIIIDDALGR